MTKKIISVIVALTMVVSLAIAAGAVNPENNTSYNYSYDANSRLIIPYIGADAVIDGDGSDSVWASALKTTLTWDNAGMIYTEFVDGEGTYEHSSAVCYYYWNYNGLFMKFVVNDPTFMFSADHCAEGGNGYDGVQLFFNPRCTTANNDTFCFSFTPYSCTAGNKLLNVSPHYEKDSETGETITTYVNNPYWTEHIITGTFAEADQDKVELASEVTRIDVNTLLPVLLTDSAIDSVTTVVRGYTMEIRIPAPFISNTNNTSNPNYFFYSGRNCNFGTALIDRMSEMEGLITLGPDEDLRDYASFFHLFGFIGDYGTRTSPMNEFCGTLSLYNQYVFGEDTTTLGDNVDTWFTLCNLRDTLNSADYDATLWSEFTTPLSNIQDALEASTVVDTEVASLISASQTAYTAMTTPAGYATGDVDNSGTITSNDARLALMASLGTTLSDPLAADAADVDGNGAITSADARNILAVSLGVATFN